MAAEEVDMVRQEFHIQLDGLIKLLAQNLYADPDVFLREMLQNAHDSITRRAELAAERNEADVPDGRITVEVDEAAALIRIHDNGCGLTRQEAEDYLSTIGRSGTDELRQRLKDRTRVGPSRQGWARPRPGRPPGGHSPRGWRDPPPERPQD